MTGSIVKRKKDEHGHGGDDHSHNVDVFEAFGPGV
jgi:hypothetical protein